MSYNTLADIYATPQVRRERERERERER